MNVPQMGYIVKDYKIHQIAQRILLPISDIEPFHDHLMEPLDDRPNGARG